MDTAGLELVTSRRYTGLAAAASGQLSAGGARMAIPLLARRREPEIYMDYQASTPVDPRVLEVMMPFLVGEPGNPHAADHAYGWRAGAAIDEARSRIAALIGADPDEVVFASGATEANNLAVLGAARAAGPNRRRVIVSAVEHKCVLAAARALADEGFEIDVVRVGADGLVDAEAVAQRVDERTAVVSVMAVNNEVGTVQPVGAIGAACRAAGVLFHSDGAQALATVPISVESWNVDLLSLSAHKAYGPKGVGALYVRRSVRSRVRPVMFGGGQEEGLRPGTLPTPLCVGFGAACEIIAGERESEAERVAVLRDTLLAALTRSCPSLSINGTMATRHPGNLNVRVPGIEADLLLAAVRPLLAIATGSACTSGTTEPSHVLSAMGLDAKAAAESIRISMGRFTTVDEVAEAADVLAAAAHQVAETLAVRLPKSYAASPDNSSGADLRVADAPQAVGFVYDSVAEAVSPRMHGVRARHGRS